MKLWPLALLSIISLSLPSQAEYRAFLLRIEKISNPEEFREVYSNMDPIQYSDYYPLQQDERIYYTDTWMCRSSYRRTVGYKKICDSPRALSEEEAQETPANLPTSVEKLN